MFLNNLAISWHLLGDSGENLAIKRIINRTIKGQKNYVIILVKAKMVIRI
jgi:hypothetical protein